MDERYYMGIDDYEPDTECSECGKTIYEDGRNDCDYISYVNSGKCSECEDE